MPIEIICNHDLWLDITVEKSLDPLTELGQNCFDAVVAHDDSCQGEAALLLTNDAHIHNLNRDFRGRDKPTNVLSFPGERANGHLGDIALGYETCLEEARDKNIPLPNHIAHLIVHGLLHLIDYDHIEEDDARKMEALEVQILAQMKIDNPY